MEEEIHVHREEEAGVRGGSAAAYAPAGAYVQPIEQGLYLKDRVRWASIWGGYLVAFALQLWLAAIGFAIFAPQAAGAVTTGAFPAGVSTALAIWTGIAALIALFVGGLLASRLAGIVGTDNGIWNGVVLWGLSFTVLLVLASLGIGGVFGAAAANVGGLGVRPGMAGETLTAVSTGVWWFVLFQLLGLLAAAGGGAVGARHAVEGEEVQR